MISLSKPNITEMELKALSEAATSDKYVLGENVYKFEEEFAKYIHVDFAVSTNSGGSALFLVNLALGKKSKVIVPAMTFIATSNSVIQAGGLPIFCDISSSTYNIDIEKVPTDSEVILPVHLYGNPVDIHSLKERAPNAIIIEDACQAHGAELGSSKVGSLGNVGVFSFYPSKNMTVMGDGGMITTNDEKIASIVAKLRDCGRKSRYLHDAVGYTMRLNSINAAVGRVQLKRLDSMNEKRRRIASLYNSMLKGVGDLVLPLEEKDAKHVYHLYVIKTSKRDLLAKFLESKGIQTGIHYDPPLHLQPIYQDMFKLSEGSFPVAEDHAKKALSIPIYPDLKDEEVRFVAQSIIEFFEK